MKKLILSTVCGFALAATTVWAAPSIKDTINQLNSAVEQILLPYQDKQTKAQLQFQNVNTDATHALQVQLKALFFKTGPSNTVTLTVNNLSYDYGNGKTPTTQVEGSLALDITKLMSQDDLNNLIKDMESTIQDMTSEYTKDYGKAVTVLAKVTEKNKDTKGNYVSAKANFTVSIDLSQLPANKKSEDIPVIGATAQITLDINKGLSIKGSLVSNPGYTGFQQNQLGLKESLDLLLKQDPAAMKQANDLAKQVNDYATDLVK